jgi:hypothetical protein
LLLLLSSAVVGWSSLSLLLFLIVLKTELMEGDFSGLEERRNSFFGVAGELSGSFVVSVAVGALSLYF